MRGSETGTSHGPESTDARGLAGQRRAEAFGRAVDRADEPEPVLTGHWTQRARRRYVGWSVLGLALAGVVVGLQLTFTVRTFEALAVLVGFTIVAVIAYTALTVSAPTVVDLDGPRVQVRRGGQTDVFDLAGPLRRVVTTGRPNRPNWRIRFETEDGRLVELGPTQIDPQVMTAALARYRDSGVPRQRRTDG